MAYNTIRNSPAHAEYIQRSVCAPFPNHFLSLCWTKSDICGADRWVRLVSAKSFYWPRSIKFRVEWKIYSCGFTELSITKVYFYIKWSWLPNKNLNLKFPESSPSRTYQTRVHVVKQYNLWMSSIGGTMRCSVFIPLD